MNEVLLFISVAVIMIAGILIVRRISNPLVIYIKLTASTGLLLLLWLTYKNQHLPMRLILTAICLSSIWRDLALFRKYRNGIN